MSVTVTDVKANRNFQRNASNKYLLALTGTTNDGAAADVQGQIVNASGGATIQAYATLTSLVIGGGNWSGILEVPYSVVSNAGVKFNLQVRTRDAGGSQISTSAGSNSWSVGDNTLGIGSSSILRWRSIGTPVSNANLLFRADDDTWALFETAGIGQGASNFMNDVQANVKCPQAWLDYGDGGTDMDDWLDPNFSTFVAAMAAASSAGIRRVVWLGGINSARQSKVKSKRAHKRNILTIRDRVRALLGLPNLPFIIVMSQKCLNDDYHTGPVDEQFDMVRDAEIECHDPANFTYLGANSLDLPVIDMPDGLHLSGTNMATQAKRTALAAIYNEAGNTGWDGRGPRISEILMDSTDPKQVEAFVVFGAGSAGTSLSPASAFVGFVHKDAGNPIASTARGSTPLRVAINCTNNTGAAPLSAYKKITYGAGAHPDTEGTSRARGNESSWNLPLEPHSGYVDRLGGIYPRARRIGRR